MNDTKEHILKITFGLFLQKNFKEVTMKEIVEKTGLSKGAFYHYFESKEKLFEEVIEHFISYVANDAAATPRDLTLQDYYIRATDQINKFNTDFFAGRDGELFNLNFFTLMFDALKIIPGFREKMADHHILEKTAWVAVIQQARETREIRTAMSNEQVAELFLYTADGLALNRTLHGNHTSIEVDIRQLWDAIYSSIRA